MDGEALSREQILDSLSTVVGKEQGTKVEHRLDGGRVAAESLGGARLRLRFEDVARDLASSFALDILGSSSLQEEDGGVLVAEK
jgi:hypothetical protein